MSKEFLYEVGDEFEGSPAGATKFIKLITTNGGLVEVDGSIVRVIWLPPKPEAEKPKAEPKSEPKPEPKPEPVQAVEVVEEKDEEAPKRRGRPKKEDEEQE